MDLEAELPVSEFHGSHLEDFVVRGGAKIHIKGVTIGRDGILTDRVGQNLGSVRWRPFVCVPLQRGVMTILLQRI